MVIEVELRAFINQEKYDELKERLSREARLIKKDDQETHYFDCEQDLRIQQAREYAKVWLKKGRLHDEQREEIEIKVRKEDFSELKKLFQALNYQTKVKWLRKRMAYDWNGITITLDDTKGYGKIIELEQLSDEDNKEKALIELKKIMKELGVKQTPREVFEEKYNDYLNHWQEIIK